MDSVARATPTVSDPRGFLPPTEEIRLNGGGMLRGRIAERTAAGTTAAGTTAAGATAAGTSGAGTTAGGTTVVVLPNRETRTIANNDIVEVVSIAPAGTVPVAESDVARPPATVPSVPTRPAVAASDPDDLRERRPGTVPLQVDSVGAVLQVGQSFSVVAEAGMLSSPFARATYRPYCQTPCTLHVEPGLFRLWTGGRGIAATTTVINVPTGGVSVDMHAPSAAAWGAGPWVMSAGLGTILAGVSMMILGAVPSVRAPGLLPAGVPVALVGLGVTIGSAVWIGRNPFGVAHRSDLNR